MNTTLTNPWFHSNRYDADSACEHCQGVVRHETWCITRNPDVVYAYEAVLDASRLAIGDSLILHALGVSWTDTTCKGTCQAATSR